MRKPDNSIKGFFNDLIENFKNLTGTKNDRVSQPEQTPNTTDSTGYSQSPHATAGSGNPGSQAPTPRLSPARSGISTPFKPFFTPPSGKLPVAKISTPKTSKPRKPFFQLSKTIPAFWTIASLISFTVNMVLLVVVLLLGRELFTLKAMVGDKLLGGLYENFIYMDQAHIQTNITVSDTIPINFTLPISQDTMVVLSRDTPITDANVYISTGGLTINSTANIVLPAGTNLPIHLELNVPVTTTVPIHINVPVDIPLDKTELHKPFIGLQQVIAPFYNLLQPQIRNAQELPLCAKYIDFCDIYFIK
ncbi:MAG: hypothetical protein WCK35_16450 [Chloroflexota bacterium]